MDELDRRLEAVDQVRLFVLNSLEEKPRIERNSSKLEIYGKIDQQTIDKHIRV